MARQNKTKSRRMFWKVYAHGVILLLVVALAIAAVAHLLGEPAHMAGMPHRVASRLGSEVGAVPQDTARLKKELERLNRLLKVEMAVVSREGRVLAEVSDTPIEKLDREQLRKAGRKRMFHLDSGPVMVLPLRRSNPHSALLIMRAPFEHNATRGITILITILVVLGLMSIPLVRLITRPVEKLTATAKKLADGDLAARSGIERKDEVGVLARTIDEMAAQLQHRLRSEKELLANISHEIRTPLSRILVALELCSEKDSSIQDIKGRLADIGQDVAELDRLVDDVLVVARLDLSDGEGQMVLRKEKTDLSVIIERALKRMSESYPGADVRANVPDDAADVFIDPALVQRVMDNLLENSAKYSDEKPRIDVDVSFGGEDVEISVKDRGTGIEEKDLPRIFEPFYRTDSSRGSTKGGSGLGLTLCRRIVEAHGGGIRAERRPDCGTSISLTLPVS